MKRKVVSKKDKYTEDLKDSLKKLNNFIKISDWKSVKDGEPNTARSRRSLRPSAADSRHIQTLFPASPI